MDKEFTFFTLVIWLYENFSLVFIINFFGSLMYDLMDTARNKTKIAISQTLATSLICSIIIPSVFDMIDASMDFSIYVLICFFTGFWSNKITYYLLDWRFIQKFLGIFLKNLGKDISDTITNTINKIDEEDKIKEENEKKEKEEHKKKSKKKDI